MQTHQELPRRPDPLAHNVLQLHDEHMLVLRGDRSRLALAGGDPELEVASGRPPHILATALPQRGESQREIRAPPAQNIGRLLRNPAFSRAPHESMQVAQHVEQMRVAVWSEGTDPSNNTLPTSSTAPYLGRECVTWLFAAWVPWLFAV